MVGRNTPLYAASENKKGISTREEKNTSRVWREGGKRPDREFSPHQNHHSQEKRYRLSRRAPYKRRFGFHAVEKTVLGPSERRSISVELGKRSYRLGRREEERKRLGWRRRKRESTHVEKRKIPL